MRPMFTLTLLLLATLLAGCGGRGSSPATPPAADDTPESRETTIDLPPIYSCNIFLNSATLPTSYQYSLVVASSITSGQIASYSWNFGGGAFPNTSTQASPMVKLTGYGGPYTGSLTVYDYCGVPRTRSFSYIVYPYLFSAYATTAPNPSSLGPIVNSGDMVAMGGTMAIASRQADSRSLRFSRGASQIPSVGNWNTNHQVAASVNPSPFFNRSDQPSIVLVNDQIKIAYFDYPTYDLHFAQATVANPTAASHWTIHTVESHSGAGVAIGEYAELVWSPSGLVLAYYVYDGGDAFASNTIRVKTTIGGGAPLFPTGSGNWTNLNFPAQPDDEGEGIDALIANNRFYMGYGVSKSDDSVSMKAGYASIPLGIANPPWTVYSLDWNLNSLRPAIGLTPAGRPVLAGNSGDTLMVAEATSATPASWANWTSHAAVTEMSSVRVHDLIYNEGKLHIAFFGQDPDVARRTASYQGGYGGRFLYIAQALVSAPNNRQHWSLIPVGSGTSWTTWSNLVTFPAPSIDRIGVLYEQPTPVWQTYAASYVPNPPPFN